MRDWEEVREDGVGDIVVVASFGASLLIESRSGELTFMLGD
jgi:hypothetical protein